VEDVAVLPSIDGSQDDRVYYIVKRTIESLDFRFLEKFAQEVECRGGTLNKQADSFVSYTGAPTAIVSAPHLAGEEVVVWADGADLGTDDSAATWVQRYTLDASGNVTLPVFVTNYVVGLAYEATFKSAKLGAIGVVSPLNKTKRLTHIGLIMHDMHPRGVRYGPSSNTIDDMPLIESGTTIGTGTQADYDQDMIEFPGDWTTDARIVLIAQAPRPVTVSAVSFDLLRFS
jgi:hypothetical protein